MTIDLDDAEVKYANKYITDLAKETNNRTEANLIKNSGKQTLTGAQALAYSRIRYTSGGEHKRTERMRVVIEAMLSKAKTLSVGKLNNLIDTIFPKVKTTNLTSGEIVEQILAVEQDNNIRISNVVFMGIGEPLNNYNNVVNAIRIINNPKGINIGARHISVSTSGLVPAIYRLADENIQCTLSISLHATTNEKRSSMMPVNNAFPIEELLQACKDYIAKTNRRISFEYALAKDNNDNLEDAKELVHLLRG